MVFFLPSIWRSAYSYRIKGSTVSKLDFDSSDQPPPADQRPPSSRKREPVFNIPGSVALLIAVCVVIHMLQANLYDGALWNWLFVKFAFVPLAFSPDFFQPTLTLLLTPIAYSFLHADWTHVGLNMIWFMVFGSPVAYRLGGVRTLIFWLVTAFAAAMLHLALYWGSPQPLIGASGAVSGFLGAAARFGFRRPRRGGRGFTQPLIGPLASLRQRGVIGFLAVWSLLNFASGQDWFGAGGSSIAWEAHIGGLIAGFLFIGFIDRPPASPPHHDNRESL